MQVLVVVVDGLLDPLDLGLLRGGHLLAQALVAVPAGDPRSEDEDSPLPGGETFGGSVKSLLGRCHSGLPGAPP
jgi:hypothetical protein